MYECINKYSPSKYRAAVAQFTGLVVQFPAPWCTSQSVLGKLISQM